MKRRDIKLEKGNGKSDRLYKPAPHVFQKGIEERRKWGRMERKTDPEIPDSGPPFMAEN